MSTQFSLPAMPPIVAEARAVKGRGTVWQIPHRFDSEARERSADGWESVVGEPDGVLAGHAACQAHDSHGVEHQSVTQVIREKAKSILAKNESPDIAFDRSINPYRGCEHGCIYCYARPTHAYVGMSPGLDFETRIIAKVNAAERLRQELSKKGYRPAVVSIGSVTDAYQPVERQLRITRGVLEVLQEFRHPMALITKSAGILRDIDILAEMAQAQLCSVYITITTLDPSLARILEPRAASPQRRLQVVRALAERGIPVGVSLSPMIPFINDPEIEKILESAAGAGASTAFCIPIRLPWEVNPLFQDWLGRHFPDRSERVMARIRDLRGGRDNDANFGSRMTGEGVWADLLAQRMVRACRQYGLNRERLPLETALFRVPTQVDEVQQPVQASLF
jgi:DNA repair photolyase